MKIMILSIMVSVCVINSGCAGLVDAINKAGERMRIEQEQRQAAWEALTPQQRRLARREDCRQDWARWNNLATDVAQHMQYRANYEICISRANEQQ